MTKEKYFEMCDMLNSEPIEEEIPVEYDDLHIDVQEALVVYNKLRDEWDYMNGNYIGKNFSGLKDIMELLEVPREDQRVLYDLINTIDSHRANAIADRKPKSTK